MRTTILSICILLILLPGAAGQSAATPGPVRVIAYYSGGPTQIDAYPVEKLTHIIFSFCHLQGQRLTVDRWQDTLTIQKLVSLKTRNSRLKVLLSLGGWGGCRSCSELFASPEGRMEFARSVRHLSEYFQTDGIDLDWEYPAIEGYPGHSYNQNDRANFTELVKVLRSTLGPEATISFAAGGFRKYLEASIDWLRVMPLVDFVNIMSYDLVNGNTPHTGHHTPLFAAPGQTDATAAAVDYLISKGVPSRQLVIGAAFYARTWEQVGDRNRGLFQSGRFKDFIAYRNFDQHISTQRGFRFYRDSIAQAPYAYNPVTKVFATFDDTMSVRKKTAYVLRKKLGGIMFWELTLDKPEHGLLEVIDQTLKAGNRKELPAAAASQSMR
ncbi:glycoside hydrolase family 18 protein [Niabella terrae]